MKLNPDQVLGALKEAKGSIDASEVLRCAVEEFGGPEGIASSLFSDFQALQPGHNNRIKILVTLVQAMLDFTGDTDDLDQETLEAVLKNQIQVQ